MDAIKKLDINIVLPPDIPQSSAMEWAKNCYERSFRRAIDIAVSSFDDSLEVVIPSISIDLGRIDECDIPFQLESKLKDEIARHIRSMSRTKSRTREDESADGDPFYEELPAQVYTHDRIRSYRDRSALTDKRRTAGSVQVKENTEERAKRKTLLPDDEATALSENVLQKDLAHSLEEELFLAYLRYVAEGYSDLEVLGKRYSFQEIASIIKTMLVSSDLPGRKEQMFARLNLTLEEHFPISFFRIKRTLPLSVFSRVILYPSSPVFPEVTRIIEAMIEERADSASVSLALFALSSFRVRQRIEGQFEKQTGELFEGSFGKQTGKRIEGQTERSLSRRNVEELASFIKVLSRTNMETADYILNPAELELLFESMPENAAYRALANVFPEKSTFSDVLNGIKRVANASVLMKKSEKQETEHRLFTDDAGLVLLHPFFRPLFNRLGLLDEQDKFLSLNSQIRAVHLLKCLAEGFKEPQDDNDLLFCKLLCGLPYEFLIDDEFRIKEQEKREIEELYGAILQYWNPFKSSSYQSMRQAFIKRKGAIEMNEKGYVIRVSGGSIDILMDDLPWEISMFFLPWTSPFIVEWQKEQ